MISKNLFILQSLHRVILTLFECNPVYMYRILNWMRYLMAARKSQSSLSQATSFITYDLQYGIKMPI